MTEDTKDVEVIEGLSALVDLDDDAGEAAIYEVGYHILSTVSEDSLENEAKTITDALTKLGAEVVGERSPASVDLAYPINKKIDGKREEFDSAYFGWVAFSLGSSDIEKVKEALDTNANVLRFLITKTSRDQVAAILADPSLDALTPEPEEVETEAEVGEVVGADTAGEVAEAAPKEEEEKS